MTKKDLKPYNNTIQSCPECGKIDVYLNDNHECNAGLEMARQEVQDNYWN